MSKATTEDKRKKAASAALKRVKKKQAHTVTLSVHKAVKASSSATSESGHALGSSTKKQKLNGAQHIAGREQDSNKSRATSSSVSASASALWFADDFSPEDLALVRAEMSTKDKGKAKARDNEIAAQVGRSAGGKRTKAFGSFKDGEKAEPGRYIAIDCEMVGVGPQGAESILARVSIVNYHGGLVLDQFVRPMEKVTDYRTWVSGVRSSDLVGAPTFAEVQKEVADLIKDRILVGHAVHNDLKALLLTHPRPLLRDTSTFAPLRELAKTKHPSLKNLARLVLGIDIQGSEHSSVEDARATMGIYRAHKDAWEASMRSTMRMWSSKVDAKGKGKGKGQGKGKATGGGGAEAEEAVEGEQDSQTTRTNGLAGSKRKRKNGETGGGKPKPKPKAKEGWWKEGL